MSRTRKNKEYKNLVLDNSDKMGDNDDVVKALSEKDKIELQFNPTVTAYVPFFNENLKKCEMFMISIDPVTNRCEFFRKQLEHDSMNKAIMEMQSLYAADRVKKIKEEQKRMKGIQTK